jgi:predicted MFS family arabinose efflux permease
MLLPRLAVFLIQTYGWRNTYRIFAVAMLAAGAIGVACVEHSPERRAAARGDGPAAPPLSGATVAGAARTRAFWLLYFASAFSTLGLYVPFVHLAPYAVDHGMTKAFGVILIGLIGVGSLVGRLGLGGTADRMGRRLSLLLTMAGMSVTTAIWLIGPYPVLLAGFALAFGVFYGGFVALMPSVTMDYFGSRSVSAILGALYTGAGVAALFGPTLAGYAFDLTHSYFAAIVGAVAAQGLAALLVMAVPDPQPARAAA